MFVHCDGLDYSVIFDAVSFLKSSETASTSTGATSDPDTYQLLKKITAEVADPTMFHDMVTVGDSLTIISKNPKEQGEPQL